VFPFYGEEFETSYMFTNGVVGFRNPTDSQVESHWCCDGRDLQTMADNEQDISRYGYAIAPLWTDLIDLEQGNSGLFVEGDTSQQTYRWKNLAEFYDITKLNSFELQIKQDGSYTVDYTAVNIQNHAITIGETGDLSTQGSYEGTQNYYYPTGYQGVPDSYGNEQNSINVFNTLCSANPLYDPQCSGYAEAYAQQLYTQECDKDATYDKDCDGYEKAYFEQQCMYDPQYDKTCNGYIEIKKEEEKFEPKELSIKGENPIQEILELPDLVTDFAGTTGYQIEGTPRASAPVIEPKREEPKEEVQEVVEERKEPVDEQDNRKQEQPIEKTVANEQAPKKVEKKQVTTKNDKLKALVSKRAVALSKKVEGAVTLEQQVVVQQQLMSLISFVPNFNYAEQEMKDLASFYSPQDNVDNAFARWFVNDKNFISLEDLQYPQRNTQWQR
jgi:hypothetical protein